MILGRPAERYQPADEAERNRVLETADRMNLKRDQDIAVTGISLYLYDTDGVRWKVVVATDGTLGTEVA